MVSVILLCLLIASVIVMFFEARDNDRWMDYSFKLRRDIIEARYAVDRGHANETLDKALKREMP